MFCYVFVWYVLLQFVFTLIIFFYLQNLFPSNPFVEMEADLSDHENVSSDEENTSGLDEYDSSFVDERETLTQAPNVDMTAKYLQSTKSPRVVGLGGFKIPNPKAKPVNDINVFSQFDPDPEMDYEYVRKLLWIKMRCWVQFLIFFNISGLLLC